MQQRFATNRRLCNHLANRTRSMTVKNNACEQPIDQTRHVTWHEDAQNAASSEEWDRFHSLPVLAQDHIQSANCRTRNHCTRSGYGSIRTRIPIAPDIGKKHRAFGFPKNIRLCIENNSQSYTAGYAVNEDNGIVALKMNGEIETCGNVPDDVSEFSHNRPVRFVALGSCGRFFVLFGNGSIGCTGSKLKKIAAENQVRCVAFGKTSWLVLFKDGRFNDSGIPDELREVISGHRFPQFISIGPRNEYFVRFQNKEWLAYAPDTNVQMYINRLRIRDKLVRTMAFGNNSVIVTYDDA